MNAVGAEYAASGFRSVSLSRQLAAVGRARDFRTWRSMMVIIPFPRRAVPPDEARAAAVDALARAETQSLHREASIGRVLYLVRPFFLN